MERTLILDTDPGVDDAIALLMAFADPATDVLAVCGVAGNVALERVMENLPAILDAAGAADVPIFAGCDRALLGDARDADGFHGANGLGDAEVAPSLRAVQDEHAAAALVRLARERAGEITLLALGPLTNVAVALALEPGLPRLLREIVIMGGTIRGEGNVTAAAEFNAWADPEAAHRVLGCGAALTLVSWETTLDHAVPWDAWDAWVGGDTPRARFVREITAAMRVSEEARGRAGFLIPDPLAAAVALAPECVLADDARPVTIELGGTLTRGQTVVDERPQRGDANVRIVRRIDMDVVEALVRRAVS